MQQLREGLFARAGLSLDDCELQVGRDDLSLLYELAPCGADGEERSGPGANSGEIAEIGQRLRRLYQILHRHLCSSTLRPEVVSAGSQWIYRLVEART